jgi:outer membrane protein TolC
VARRSPLARAPHLAKALLLVLGTCATGCTVGPDYEIPGAPVPFEFKELDGWKIATPRDDMDRGAWWSVYGDYNLNSLLQQVDVSNQNIAYAEAAFRQSVTIVQQARAGLFPVLGFVYNANCWHEGPGAIEASGFPATDSITRTTVTMEPQLSWTADVWGKIRRQIESDVSNAQASAADYANARLSAQGQLALAYFSLRAADSLRQLLDETVATYKKTYEITLARFKYGRASLYDVKTAETQLETTKAQAIGVGVQRAQFEHAIAMLIGSPPSYVSIAWSPLGRSIPFIPPGLPSACSNDVPISRQPSGGSPA